MNSLLIIEGVTQNNFSMAHDILLPGYGFSIVLYFDFKHALDPT